MIRPWLARPGHQANVGIVPARAAIAPLPDADLVVASANVAAWGGNPVLFRHWLAAGLDADPDADPRQVSAVAAWRAGALALRAEALALLPALPARAVAATLGFGDVATFADRQRVDPYWWPGRDAANGLVLWAGGFAGLGGPWLAPPTMIGRTYISGRWVVRAGTSWWQLDADVFGALLTELGDSHDDRTTGDPYVVQAHVTPASYFVSLHASRER